MKYNVGDRVQDKAGLTGTVSDQWTDHEGAPEYEITWDISGCASDENGCTIEPMKEGQDNYDLQNKIHEETFKETSDADHNHS